jgi:GT2 family glycosyltransferase
MVILVDNGSRDGSLESLTAEFPSLETVRNKTNLGFCGGVNQGLRRARAMGFDYYLLLNNDTTVAPDFLEPLVEAAEQDGSIGGISPLILRMESPHRAWYAAGRFNWWICESRPVAGRAPVSSSAREVNFLTGCAMFLRASAVESLGPFDDRFFAYFEDVDYSARLRRSGYRTLYVPQARVWHRVSASVGQNRAGNLTRRHVYRNRLLLMQKHGRTRHWIVFLPTYVLYYVGLRLVAYSLLLRWDHVRALVAGIGDFFRVRRMTPSSW